MSGITRRNFIGASGAAAGIALANTIQSKARGDSGKIRLGIIGVGARGQQHLREGLWGSKDFEIVAVADVYGHHQTGGRNNAWIANAGLIVPDGGKPAPEQMEALEKVLKPSTYYDYKEMLAKEELVAVLIATPPHTHAAMIKDCLAAGKHVFCETPMTTSVNDARDVVTESQKSGLVVQIGHQRRYHPNYNLVMKRCREDGGIGHITQAQVERHVNSPGRRNFDYGVDMSSIEKDFIQTDMEHFLNWRLYMDPAGGPFFHEVAPCIDAANWFSGAPPLRVFATGKSNYWLDERTAPDNFSAIFTFENRRMNGVSLRADAWATGHDNARLSGPYRWQCAFAFSLTNARRGTRELFYGDRGTCELSSIGDCALTPEAWVAPFNKLTYDEKTRIIIKTFGLTSDDKKQIDYYLSLGSTKNPLPRELRSYNAESAPINALGSEESAEVHQFRAFAEHIRNGGTPRANVMVGLAAVIAGESARRSYETGQPVDIDPALMDFDFETPSISLYDTNAAPIPGTTELM